MERSDLPGAEYGSAPLRQRMSAEVICRGRATAENAVEHRGTEWSLEIQISPGERWYQRGIASRFELVLTSSYGLGRVSIADERVGIMPVVSQPCNG